MKLVFGILIFFTLISCKSEPKVDKSTFWKVSDVTKSEERIAVLLEEKPKIINILIKGEVDAPFQITASGLGDRKVFDFKKGAIDTILSDYWKSSICKTMYVPKGVKSGDINISVLLYSKEK